MDPEKALRDESTLSVPEYVLARRSGSETVLLNLDNEQYYGLSGVGTRLWELLEAGTTFGRALAALLAEYDIDRDALVADITRTVIDLQKSGLVLINAT